MKKNIVVGLLGAITNNGNMGCVALTYSIIKACELVAEQLNVSVSYVIFEAGYRTEKIRRMCQELNIDEAKVTSVEQGYIHKWTSCVKYATRNSKMIQKLKECNVVIDLTQGDSFTDAYGDERFFLYTKIKEKVEKLDIPLILGPQTYGPFENEKNKRYAKKVIENAACVISRDQKSADYIKFFSDKEVLVTTDLAFMLPYDKREKKSNAKIKVGVNISSLLVKNKLESTDSKFQLSVDYDAYIDSILKALSENEQYEIHLIPHVGEDAGYLFASKFPNAILHNAFTTPIEAKNCISQMDVFIGARMHATVAAFSTGVATIPTAYSRKFSGLYNNLGYSYVVDLQSMDITAAVERTMDYVKRYKELQAKGTESMQFIKNKSESTIQILSEQFKSIL